MRLMYEVIVVNTEFKQMIILHFSKSLMLIMKTLSKAIVLPSTNSDKADPTNILRNTYAKSGSIDGKT